jgi:hypothetical protein
MKFKFYEVLSIISYILVGVGIFYGVQQITENNIKQGIILFIQIGVLPLSFIAFLRHNFVGTQNTVIKSHPFFEMEAGGANLGVFVGLLVGTMLNLSARALASILLVYLVYLTVACFVSVKYLGYTVLLRFLPLLLSLTYFVVKGLEPTLNKSKQN